MENKKIKKEKSASNPQSRPSPNLAGTTPKTRSGPKGASRPKTIAPHRPSRPSKTPEAQPTLKEPPATARPSYIEIPESLTVRELAQLMRVSPIEVIKELMNNGIMANINQQIDYETAVIVAEEMGFETKEATPLKSEEPEPALPQPIRHSFYEDDDPASLRPRPPVVTVMGHVDHGKTSLLDVIRHTNVVADEAGGITQHIGAYQVEIRGKKITFLDTPGHEAFTAMRARGAQATDVAVLVVAADDGVMPQTKEAIDHARAAQVPIIVALNKMDKANANPEMVKKQLSEMELVVEEWGGDVICVPISAKKGTGIEELLENILLVTEVADLKANPNRPAVGTVIESKLDKARGPMATLLVQNGTLHLGDNLIIGSIYGRVRAMFNDKGKPITSAEPSTPVAILGLPDVPRAGDIFRVVPDEKTARAEAARIAEEMRQATARPAKAFGLDDLYAHIKSGQIKELNIILKADVQGSLEPITSSLEKLGDENLKVKILHQGTGNISESDIMLAIASKAIVIGFNVEVSLAARRLAETEGVDIRLYEIIYKLIEDVDKALKGLLEPEYKDVVIGHAEVKAIFNIPSKGKVAGIQVADGRVTRQAFVRAFREGTKIFEGSISSLKRFREDVTEVKAGFECGIGLEGFDSFEVGDKLEFYVREKVS
ncbi:MAG: translation initiation factor IF-2 [Anaerolineae bacterium]